MRLFYWVVMLSAGLAMLVCIALRLVFLGPITAVEWAGDRAAEACSWADKKLCQTDVKWRWRK